MDQADAVRAAIDVLRVPTRLPALRSKALPTGVTALLEIAAGDAVVCQTAAATVGDSEAVVRAATAFFIEQILLFSGNDSYRVLGASADASSAELRRNMSLLMRCLHPDSANVDHSIFARRVLGAWENLKTPERRVQYDAKCRNAAATSPTKRLQRRRGLLSKQGSKSAPTAGGSHVHSELSKHRSRTSENGFMRGLRDLFERLQR